MNCLGDDFERFDKSIKDYEFDELIHGMQVSMGYGLKLKDLGINVHHYLDNTDNRYSDYRTVCSHIKREIRNDQIQGGMVGQYKNFDKDSFHL